MCIRVGACLRLFSSTGGVPTGSFGLLVVGRLVGRLVDWSVGWDCVHSVIERRPLVFCDLSSFVRWVARVCVCVWRAGGLIRRAMRGWGCGIGAFAMDGYMRGVCGLCGLDSMGRAHCRFFETSCVVRSVGRLVGRLMRLWVVVVVVVVLVSFVSFRSCLFDFMLYCSDS